MCQISSQVRSRKGVDTTAKSQICRVSRHDNIIGRPHDSPHIIFFIISDTTGAKAEYMEDDSAPKSTFSETRPEYINRQQRCILLCALAGRGSM
jgi:hypothetical protein